MYECFDYIRSVHCMCGWGGGKSLCGAGIKLGSFATSSCNHWANIHPSEFELNKLSQTNTDTTQCGAQTHDPGIKSPKLYRLSQPGSRTPPLDQWGAAGPQASWRNGTGSILSLPFVLFGVPSRSVKALSLCPLSVLHFNPHHLPLPHYQTAFDIHCKRISQLDLQYPAEPGDQCRCWNI